MASSAAESAKKRARSASVAPDSTTTDATLDGAAKRPRVRYRKNCVSRNPRQAADDVTANAITVPLPAAAPTAAECEQPQNLLKRGSAATARRQQSAAEPPPTDVPKQPVDKTIRHYFAKAGRSHHPDAEATAQAAADSPKSVRARRGAGGRTRLQRRPVPPPPGPPRLTRKRLLLQAASLEVPQSATTLVDEASTVATAVDTHRSSDSAPPASLYPPGHMGQPQDGRPAVDTVVLVFRSPAVVPHCSNETTSVSNGYLQNPSNASWSVARYPPETVSPAPADTSPSVTETSSVMALQTQPSQEDTAGIQSRKEEKAKPTGPCPPSLPALPADKKDTSSLGQALSQTVPSPLVVSVPPNPTLPRSTKAAAPASSAAGAVAAAVKATAAGFSRHCDISYYCDLHRRPRGVWLKRRHSCTGHHHAGAPLTDARCHYLSVLLSQSIRDANALTPTQDYFRYFQSCPSGGRVSPMARRAVLLFMIEIGRGIAAPVSDFSIHMAINLFDRYLSRLGKDGTETIKERGARELEAVGAACLFICSKLEDCWTLSLGDICRTFDQGSEKRKADILFWELEISRRLGFALCSPTLFDFLYKMIELALPYLDGRSSSGDEDEDDDSTTPGEASGTEGTDTAAEQHQPIRTPQRPFARTMTTFVSQKKWTTSPSVRNGQRRRLSSADVSVGEDRRKQVGRVSISKDEGPFNDGGGGGGGKGEHVDVHPECGSDHDDEEGDGGKSSRKTVFPLSPAAAVSSSQPPWGPEALAVGASRLGFSSPSYFKKRREALPNPAGNDILAQAASVGEIALLHHTSIGIPAHLLAASALLIAITQSSAGGSGSRGRRLEGMIRRLPQPVRLFLGKDRRRLPSAVRVVGAIMDERAAVINAVTPQPSRPSCYSVATTASSGAARGDARAADQSAASILTDDERSRSRQSSLNETDVIVAAKTAVPPPQEGIYRPLLLLPASRGV